MLVTTVPFEYFYLVLSLPFMAAWVVLFLVGKHTRKEQLLMSLWFTPLGPLSEIFFLQDYWTPLDIRIARIPLTELIWAFTSGLAAGPFYAFATGRRIVKV